MDITTEDIVLIIGAIAALVATGFVIRIVVNRKKTTTIQKGNTLSGGSQMAGRDIKK